MANVEVKHGLSPSLIDRLIDPESRGTTLMIGYDVRQMSEAVRRDLEDLLNARCTPVPNAERFPEVSSSIAVFGLPDLVSTAALSAEHRTEIGRVIEMVIERYEPRLKAVRATLLDPHSDEARGAVRFRIDAELNVDPAPAVSFDTILDVASGHLAVRTAADE